MADIFLTNEHELVRSRVSTWLSEATRKSGLEYAPSDLTLKLVDQDQIVGGLSGSTNWNWLYIETLAIAPEYRGQGLARLLVERAEEVALERGCCGCWVDTFTFQVPDFYIRLGYEVFGELPNYPDSDKRIFLRKQFAIGE